MENELKSYQQPVITDILMSYPAIKDYRNQAYRLSYPNAKNIEVRRCRVSVLNIYIYIYTLYSIEKNNLTKKPQKTHIRLSPAKPRKRIRPHKTFLRILSYAGSYAA